MNRTLVYYLGDWFTSSSRRVVEITQTMKDLGINRMNLEDRLTLVQEIWDSIAAELEGMPLTEAQQRELERRLAAHATDPSQVISWEEVKARALARAKR